MDKMSALTKSLPAPPANHKINRAHDAVVEQVTAITDDVLLMSGRRVVTMISSSQFSVSTVESKRSLRHGARPDFTFCVSVPKHSVPREPTS